jgi:uncharacterized protein (DUF427 family)
VDWSQSGSPRVSVLQPKEKHMRDYPAMIVPVDHIEPVPRRIRATLGGQTVLDTTHALYVWEWSNYPQYYIPIDDVRRELLVDEQHTQRLHRGTAHLHGLRVREITRPVPYACTWRTQLKAW